MGKEGEVEGEVERVLRMCVEVEDVRKGLESIRKEKEQLKEGRMLIERAWLHFKKTHNEEVTDLLNTASRIVEKKIELLERSEKVFEEELRRLEG